VFKFPTGIFTFPFQKRKKEGEDCVEGKQGRPPNDEMILWKMIGGGKKKRGREEITRTNSCFSSSRGEERGGEQVI